ncbi:hypothetical protein S83_028666, partial [Arachis hypogaea]
IEEIRRRELLLRYGAGLVLTGEEPCLDALSVVGDAGGDGYGILHDFKRDWAEKEQRNIDLIIHTLMLYDPDLAQKIGATTALEVRVTRIPYVCRDPRWGWCYKSYSEDLKIVKKTMSSEDCLGWAARDASGHLSPYKFNC